jgi:NADH-quinone oxidoreductase E subunit
VFAQKCGIGGERLDFAFGYMVESEPRGEDQGVDESRIDVMELIEKHGRKRSDLIPILQEIQGAFGYIPRDVVELIAKELGIFPVEVYEILTFYAQFRLRPRGKFTIKVCLGTACHVMGGHDIFDYVSNKLEVQAGGTTKDGLFTLERVACLGCCGMAPVVVINDRVYGRQTIQSVDELLRRYSEASEGIGDGG